MNKKLFFQLMRFGIVGCTAAALHFTIVVFLVETNGFKPLYANAVAFFFSFQVSYSGNRFWTFRDTQAQHRAAISRLLLLQLCNFMANEALFYFFMTYFHLPYTIALLLVLSILPLITFTVSKLWVFR